MFVDYAMHVLFEVHVLIEEIRGNTVYMRPALNSTYFNT